MIWNVFGIQKTFQVSSCRIGRIELREWRGDKKRSLFQRFSWKFECKGKRFSRLKVVELTFILSSSIPNPERGANPESKPFETGILKPADHFNSKKPHDVIDAVNEFGVVP